MQKEVEEIEIEINQRIYKLFLSRFKGNNSAFARAANCNEKTVRRVFKNEQGLTINLLFKFSHALNIDASEVIRDLRLMTKK